MIKIHDELSPLSHGGDLDEAIKQYGRPKEDWLDMSTGISPWVYPVAPLDEHVWQNLPPSSDQLLTAAAEYYQALKSDIVVSPGSQLLIRLLPHCLSKTTVAVPAIGYQEHAYSWQLAGHTLVHYNSTDELANLIELDEVEHVVLINPNNPSGEMRSLDFMKSLLVKLKGLLVVDEAFIDPFLNNKVHTRDELNSAVQLDSPKVVVLRSMGKFFGLAGIRVGFAISSSVILKKIQSLLQPWSISHASLVIAQQALSDKAWHQKQITRINKQSTDFKILLKGLCNNLDRVEVKHCLLFTTVFSDSKSLEKLHQKLAEKGVWTRLFNEGDDPAWLRFSLPSNIAELEKRLQTLIKD